MRFLAGLTLGKKTAILAGAGLAAAIAVLGFLGIRAVSESVDSMLQDRLTLARLTGDYVEETLERVTRETETVAAAITSGGFWQDPAQYVDRLQMVTARLSMHVVDTYVVDSRGQVTWSETAAGQSVPVDLSEYQSVSQALATGASTVSGLLVGPASGMPVVLVTSASQPAEGQRSALVVAIDIGKSSIAGLVQPVRLGQTGYAEIVDQNGVVVARTEPGPTLAPFEVSDHSGRFAALIAAGQPTRGVCHSCHEPVQKVERRDVLAFVPLATVRWGVVVRQSEDEAFKPIRDLRQNLIFAGLGLVGVASVLITVTTRQVIGRISLLTGASNRIARGDLVTPIPRMSGDELGTLAQTLDDMRSRLHSLHEEVRRKDEARGELLRGILTIQEEERRRIARELHDETSQVLASLAANLQALSSVIPSSNEKALALVKKTQALSVRILDEIHRLIYELRPSLLDDMGLVPAARWLVENTLQPAGIRVQFRTGGQPRRLPAHVEASLYRIMQEAVNNIVRHAHAKHVELGVHFREGVVAVHIRDDGRGFDVEEAINAKDRPRGLGLMGMQERAAQVGGTLSMRSRPDGGGTDIDITIPFSEVRPDGQDQGARS